MCMVYELLVYEQQHDNVIYNTENIKSLYLVSFSKIFVCIKNHAFIFPQNINRTFVGLLIRIGTAANFCPSYVGFSNCITQRVHSTDIMCCSFEQSNFT
jgi:hypothetical protein